MANTTWRLRGEAAGGCNCAWGCPCQFNALPTSGRCEGLMSAIVEEGFFGDLRLDGVRFAAAFKWPGAIHEGNGTLQLILDERATPAQRAALQAITSGTHGGAIFEIFSMVAGTRPEPIVTRIDIEMNRERRVASLTIDGLVDYRAEPIRNPVTGEEHRAQIRLPNGFEYKEAEMGNTTRLDISAGPIAFEHHDCYAQFNAFDWSNS